MKAKNNFNLKKLLDSLISNDSDISLVSIQDYRENKCKKIPMKNKPINSENFFHKIDERLLELKTSKN